MPCTGSTTNAATSPRASARSSASRSPHGTGSQSGSSGPKPVAKDGVAVERQRAERQPVKGVLGVEHARATGRGAGDLDRRLDRLGAGVRGHHRPDRVGRAREQLLGQNAAQQRDAELGQVGECAPPSPPRSPRSPAGGSARSRTRRSRRTGRGSARRRSRSDARPRPPSTSGRTRACARSGPSAGSDSDR